MYNFGTDDENDQLFFMRKSKSGKWSMENIEITPVKLDLIQFELGTPVEK